ncbi:hypothetical protein [Shivajiella indica]|uniref:Uncharacterized protein n=1 Tax=Shivajiella indica TaxID=872115 RepID=A0ABW5BBI7_9BACT
MIEKINLRLLYSGNFGGFWGAGFMETHKQSIIFFEPQSQQKERKESIYISSASGEAEQQSYSNHKRDKRDTKVSYLLL